MFNSKHFNIASEYNSNDIMKIVEPALDILGNESVLNLTQIEEQNESHVVNTGDISYRQS